MVTSTSSELKFYVNGILDASATNVNWGTDNSLELGIGARPNPPAFDPAARFFRGLIDEVKIYDTTLSASEVSALHDSELLASGQIIPEPATSGTFGEQQVITTNANGAVTVFASDLDDDGDDARPTVTDQQSVAREAVSAVFAQYEHARQVFGTGANSRTSDNADDLSLEEYLKQDGIERIAELFAEQDDK